MRPFLINGILKPPVIPEVFLLKIKLQKEQLKQKSNNIFNFSIFV